MDYRFKQLEQELSALSKVFGELGARLSEVAKEVVAPGVTPTEKLLEQISAARTNFDNVRTAVHGHASAMLISPLPKIAEVVSITALDALLKASAVAEENRFSIDDERERTLGILSRVLSITHREGDFKPLQECNAKIGELRNGIAKVAWPHRHAESESIIAMKHPATALLSFLENLDTLEDERWIALEATITEHYGKPLFVAASRGKLVLPTAKAPAQVSMPPKPAPVVAEKPAEKKVVAEKVAEKPAVPVAQPVVEKKIVAQPAPAPAPPKPAAPAQPAAAASDRKDSEKAQGPAPAAVAPVNAPAPPVVAHIPAPIAPAPVIASTPIAPVAVAQVPTAAAPVAPAPVAAPTSAAPAPAAPVAATPAPPRPVAPPPQVVQPAAPAPVAQTAAPSAPPTQTGTIHSLSALATATEPAVERKPAAPPVENGDRQRKEPRLAAPAPQPVARMETKPQEQELVGEEAQKAVNGDGSQRPQRWGFWRGNR